MLLHLLQRQVSRSFHIAVPHSDGCVLISFNRRITISTAQPGYCTHATPSTSWQGYHTQTNKNPHTHTHTQFPRRIGVSDRRAGPGRGGSGGAVVSSRTGGGLGQAGLITQSAALARNTRPPASTLRKTPHTARDLALIAN